LRERAIEHLDLVDAVAKPDAKSST